MIGIPNDADIQMAQAHADADRIHGLIKAGICHRCEEPLADRPHGGVLDGEHDDCATAILTEAKQ